MSKIILLTHLLPFLSIICHHPAALLWFIHKVTCLFTQNNDSFVSAMTRKQLSLRNLPRDPYKTCRTPLNSFFDSLSVPFSQQCIYPFKTIFLISHSNLSQYSSWTAWHTTTSFWRFTKLVVILVIILSLYHYVSNNSFTCFSYFTILA